MLGHGGRFMQNSVISASTRRSYGCGSIAVAILSKRRLRRNAGPESPIPAKRAMSETAKHKINYRFEKRELKAQLVAFAREVVSIRVA